MQHKYLELIFIMWCGLSWKRSCPLIASNASPTALHSPVGLVPMRNGPNLLWKNPWNKRWTEGKLSSFLKGGKRGGLKCAQLYEGTVISQYIRDKSRAYLEVHLRDIRCKLCREAGRGHTDRACCSLTRLEKDKDKSSVVLENLCSDVAWKAPGKVQPTPPEEYEPTRRSKKPLWQEALVHQGLHLSAS